MSNTNRTILVTGGAGFIGSALVRYLLEKTHNKIVNVDKLTYAGNLASLKTVENHPRYAFVQADICDTKALSYIFHNINLIPLSILPLKVMLIVL